jgi:hypothetical protein
MPTFIKPGFWNKKRNKLAGELNLDLLIQDNSSGANYKSYVALVTQVGTYPIISSGTPLVIGVTYMVSYLAPGDDFSNVGYVATQVPFVATGTTPTTWTNGSELIEPISSVLPTFEIIENTLGIILTPSIRTNSSFFLDSNLPVFLQNKTFVSPQSFMSTGFLFQGGGLVRINDSQLALSGFTIGDVMPFTIKIEVYN